RRVSRANDVRWKSPAPSPHLPGLVQPERLSIAVDHRLAREVSIESLPRGFAVILAKRPILEQRKHRVQRSLEIRLIESDSTQRLQNLRHAARWDRNWRELRPGGFKQNNRAVFQRRVMDIQIRRSQQGRYVRPMTQQLHSIAQAPLCELLRNRGAIG